MFNPFNASRFATTAAVWLGILLLQTTHVAAADEFRALWVDAFHSGFKTASQVTQLIADARAGNFNAVIVQVRKRGDAYYNSSIEPKAADIASTFDPLADLIAKAHNTQSGPRIEVHGWLVAYHIWNNQSTPPSQPNHPYNLHRDWLTKDVGGAQWDGGNYSFDPAHPGVQKHTFDVVMDMLSRYDIDGVHFDYIRYAGNTWGYNDVAVARFNRKFSRTGTPSATDPAWLQFRRDEVTALVRKVYVSAAALKSRVKISAATITWAPGITTDAQWANTAAYARVLQDWRGWMQEGILDLNIPMAYFDQQTYATDYANWGIFAKNHRYNRHVAIGPGIYLNTVSNSIVQIRGTRTATSTGNRADGVCMYSYAVPNDDGVPRSTFLSALTSPSVYDSNPTPVFSTRAVPPAMPWKNAPTKGHLKGMITDHRGEALDGATLRISGVASRTFISDGTGFFATVDLAPGDYSLTAQHTGFESVTIPFAIAAGSVTTRNISLVPPLELVFFTNIVASSGSQSAAVSWRTQSPVVSFVEYGVAPSFGLATPIVPIPRTNHSAFLSGLAASQTYSFRLVARLDDGELRSQPISFRTAGELIIDNTSASFTGPWTTASSATDKYGTDYRYASTVSGSSTATATFQPEITTPGFYDVYVWYSQGSNRATNVLVEIAFDGGTFSKRFNQQAGGGQWQLVAPRRHFKTGSTSFVRISNSTGEFGRVVMADAVRWVYSPDQDSPPAGTVPEWWAAHYFGGNVAGTADHDADGYSTYAEYVTGTTPNDPSSRLAFAIESPAFDVARAAFAPWHAGRRYTLMGAASVAIPSWQPVTGAVLQTNGLGGASMTVNDAPAEPAFYRLRVEMP